MRCLFRLFRRVSTLLFLSPSSLYALFNTPNPLLTILFTFFRSFDRPARRHHPNPSYRRTSHFPPRTLNQLLSSRSRRHRYSQGRSRREPSSRWEASVRRGGLLGWAGEGGKEGGESRHVLFLSISLFFLLSLSHLRPSDTLSFLNTVYPRRPQILAWLVDRKLNSSPLKLDDRGRAINFVELAGKTEGYSVSDLGDLVGRSVQEGVVRSMGSRDGEVSSSFRLSVAD